MYRSFRRFGRRNLFISIICVVLLYLLFSSSEIPESVHLEHHMNNGANEYSWISHSSFDFSTVNPRYAPLETVSLPVEEPSRLPRIQHVFPPESVSMRKVREARRQDIRQVFQKNWQSYRRFAWMQDALLPISAKGKDQFSGWAATLVDSLDTLWIMGLREAFDEAVNAVADIDFGTSTSGRVNMFESNIRYLGGLLGAYDLSKRKILLQKAIEIGDLLYAGFNTPNRMPVDFIDFEQAKTGDGLIIEPSVVSASPGTLSMEFTRLSQLTGDPKYYSAISHITSLFARYQNRTALPGMWPMRVSMSIGDVQNGSAFTLGGNADSLYEYLPKMVALLSTPPSSDSTPYAAMSTSFLTTAAHHLIFRPMLPGAEDILISGAVTVHPDALPILDPESEHLTCFIGGVYALASRLFSRPDYLDLGVKLARGCAYAYAAMPTGMMPERFTMVPCPSSPSTSSSNPYPYPDKCPWNATLYATECKKRPERREHIPMGFTTAKDPRYILRPEAIESVFVLWRITGLREFEDAAWEMWRAVSKGTETEWANAAVMDVTNATFPLRQEDYMESFWLAETMKYFYLVFSPPDVISLDDFVLNTEAHPFRRSTRS